MFGPQGTRVHPTFTPCLIACLIVGVSGPPSFGPMNQAWYFFETSASRSWLTCVLVVNFASNTVRWTFGYFVAMSFAPSSSASQYVFADEARNTPTLIVFCGLPDAAGLAEPLVAATTAAAATAAIASVLLILVLPSDPLGFREINGTKTDPRDTTRNDVCSRHTVREPVARRRSVAGRSTASSSSSATP